MSNHLQIWLQRQHILLSYFKTLSVGPVWGSNPRPPAQQTGALPTELTRRRFFALPCWSKKLIFSISVSISGTDRTNVCWVKEGCSSLKPAACSSLPLEVVDHVDKFDAAKLNLHLNKGCYTDEKKPLQPQLDNAPASCNPPCFRITKPGEYCYMGTRNNNFSNRRHVGQITVTEATGSVAE